MSKAAQLKNMIGSDNLEFILEAHNGLSAKIVEEAGFKGIWGSGLSISAALGVRDNNEASWTQVLEVLEFMSDAVSIPILLDGDTGYGNFNNMRRLVRKLEQREIAGVCIEDKLFPKTNSFIKGESQPLADIEEFCRKISAGKDTQRDDNFQIVARTEAFIAGWGLDEALKRAEAYRKAGADAILVHSKKSRDDDIEAFVKEWGDRHPIVIVPTKYYSTPTQKFRDMNVSMVIWANHLVRTSIDGMQKTAKRIFDDQSLNAIEGEVASVSEIFRLQGAQELIEAEKRYLPATGNEYKSIVLGAARGERLGELTENIPKTMISVNGTSVLKNQVDRFRKAGINSICVVTGFKSDTVDMADLEKIENTEHATTTDLYSLSLALGTVEAAAVISYGDILFKSFVLKELLDDDCDITLIADSNFSVKDSNQDYVVNTEPYDRKLFGRPVGFKKMGPTLHAEAHGEFIGMWKVSKQGAEIVKAALKEYEKDHDLKTSNLVDFFNYLGSKHEIAVRYISDGWMDIDTIVDVVNAGEF